MSLSNEMRDIRTRQFTTFVRSQVSDAFLDATEIQESGNVDDGPAYVFEVTGSDGEVFNIEVTGPPWKENE